MEQQKMEASCLTLGGAYVLKPAIFEDARGSFTVLHEEKELEKLGINCRFKLEFLVKSKKGVVRGLHYQSRDAAQAKLVRCIRGEICDVIVDLRKKSSTFGKWEMVRLSQANKYGLYVPRGMAHGYQALEEETEVLYAVDNYYNPQAERGVRYDDVGLGIPWPIRQMAVVSERDLKLPGFLECEKFE